MPPVSSVMIGNENQPSQSTAVLNQSLARTLAREAGFLEAGVVSLPHPGSSRDAQRFEQFIQSGYAGSMEYLARRNDQGALVRADVRTPFPWARSIVVCLAGYHAPAPLSTAPAPSGAGWI